MNRELDPDVRLLRGAADPNRLAILRRLQCEGSVAACDFRCCNVAQPTVSHHLKVLREAGWVRTEHRASRVYYSLEPGVVERFVAIAGELMPPARRDRHEMTKYTIDADGSSVAIELTDVAGRQAELLEAFGDYQEGRCSCPTDEYRKVATMEVEAADDRIAIRLEAKSGMSLDTSEIAACLDYTVGAGEV